MTLLHESLSTDTLVAATQPQKLRYAVGLDLGQSQDFSAMAILETPAVDLNTCELRFRFLKRWPLRTPYPAIVDDTVKIVNDLHHRTETYPLLAVDATGCGAPVVDLFKRERISANLRPVLITGGAEENYDNGTHRVPKRNLVSLIQVPLQQGRLKIASELPDAAVLVRELENFQAKISDAGSDSYGAWREGTHDDLVLAVALAIWGAANYNEGRWFTSEFLY